MAKKKPSHPDSLDKAIPLTETVSIRVVDNEAVRKRIAQTTKELMTARGYISPQLVNVTHEDVKRMARLRGIVDPLKPKDRRERQIVTNLVGTVQSHYVQIQEGARLNALFIELLADAFVVERKRAVLRPDVASVVGQEAITQEWQDWFRYETFDETALAMPDVIFDEGIVPEQKVALLQAVFKAFPALNDAFAEVLSSRYFEEDGQTDTSGFPT